MLSMQLTSIREALDLLKRIEIIETQEMYNKGQSLNSKRGISNYRTESAQYTNGRNKDRSQVRQIQ
jgi:hypothetical protein